MISAGHIEHYFASILAAIRELEEMFPSGEPSKSEFLTQKSKLLQLFHKMGSNAKRVAWHEPVWLDNPHSRFSEFTPDRLDSRKFSIGYFRRCMEETVGDPDLTKTLSLLAGEGNAKYENVKKERERKRDALLLEHSDVRQKCWFLLVALATLLLGSSGVIIGAKAWIFYILFLPPLLGSIPLGRVVFLTFDRAVGVEDAETAWNQTRLDVIWSAIRDIDTEITDLQKNQNIWLRGLRWGGYGMSVGILISLAITPYLL